MKLTRRGVRAMGIEQQHQLLGGLGGRHPAAGTGADPGRNHGSERIAPRPPPGQTGPMFRLSRLGPAGITALAARVRPEGGGPRRTRWTDGLRVGTSVLVLACLKDGREI